MEVADRVVVITGGAAGIGRAAAKAMAREGAVVVIADIDEEGSLAAAAAIEAGAGRAEAFRCDVSDGAQVDALRDHVLARHGRVDILLNNAFLFTGGSATEIDMALWRRGIAVNLLGYVEMIRAFVPPMLAAGGGHIINTASGLAIAPQPIVAEMLPYISAKSGVVGLSQALALALRPRGIGVTLFCPGVTATDSVRRSVGLADSVRDRVGDLMRSSTSADAAAETLLDGLRRGDFLISTLPDFQLKIVELARHGLDPAVEPVSGNAPASATGEVFALSSQVERDEIPVIDISKTTSAHDRARIARRIDDAFSGTGFLTIVGHGFQQSTVDALEAAARDFFARPEAEKRLAMSEKGAGHRGYVPMASQTASRALGIDAPYDLVEGFGMSSPHHPISNIWPACGALKETMEAYYREIDELAMRLLPLFAAALRIDDDYFRDKFGRGEAVLKVNNYPRQQTRPLPRQLRVSPHTDFGAFTLLRAREASGASGLQIRRRHGGWMDVAAPAGSFIINVGDMMMRWTNNRWRSTLHQVINPVFTGKDNADRISIPFFFNPDPSALIECVPTCWSDREPPAYASITAGQHRAMMLARAFDQSPKIS